MQVQLLRDSIIGVGKIERPEAPFAVGGGRVNLGDAVQCGLVVEPKVGHKGDIVNLSETDAVRMIQLGSARIPAEQQPKKAA